jgi:hypothetical protein
MTGHEEVDRLVAVITVDCHNPSEQVTAFYEVFVEEVPLPLFEHRMQPRAVSLLQTEPLTYNRYLELRGPE